MTLKLGIIGGGNMGAAIIRGAIRAGVIDAKQVIIAEVDKDRRKKLEPLGCALTDDPKKCLDAEQLLLAVKPQSFPAVAKSLVGDPLGRAPLHRSTIVISIMAGLSSGKIRSALGDSARIVRAMPNTPAQINLGMTAIALGEGANPGDDTLANELFSAVGKVINVEEKDMYAVTALSGSGPAYVFLLAEAMQQAGEQMGLNHAAARDLVTQTIRGAGELLHQSEQTADALRQAVTSPGGTTAAAMEYMFEKELPDIITEALMAARNRGIELDQAE